LQTDKIKLYYKLKNKGIPDNAIAEGYFFISVATLSRWKKKNGIRVGQKVMEERFKNE
jgi:hypothetical protein